jgi:hypothetical protein
MNFVKAPSVLFDRAPIQEPGADHRENETKRPVPIPLHTRLFGIVTNANENVKIPTTWNIGGNKRPRSPVQSSWDGLGNKELNTVKTKREEAERWNRSKAALTCLSSTMAPPATSRSHIIINHQYSTVVDVSIAVILEFWNENRKTKAGKQ